MKRQTIAIILTIISLILLIGLVAFWLQRTYDQQREILKKEVGFAFSSSVSFLQDSLVSVEWEKHLSDSTFLNRFNKNLPSNISMHLRSIDSLSKGHLKSMSIQVTKTNEDADTTPVKEESSIRFFRPDSDEEINNRSHRDTGRHFYHQMWTYKRSMGQIKFLMAGNDSIQVKLDPSELIDLYNRNLKLQGINITGSVLIDSSFNYNRGSADGIIQTLAIPAGHPVMYYTGQVAGAPFFILKRMKFELGVSLLLILLVLTSYWITWKNLNEQKKLFIMRNDLIANITHELKTPVSTVHVALEAIQNFGVIHDEKKTRSYLSIAQAELDRLDVLINKILKVKAFEDGQLNWDIQVVDLKNLLYKVQQVLLVFLKEKSAKLDLQLDSKDILIKGDPVHLTNAFINLVENAVKYSKDHPRVTITSHHNDRYVHIEIEDNGPGIPDMYKEKIFDRFFRVPDNNKHNIKGHGLGLSYVKEVIVRHDGHIELEKSDITGSRFTIKLPIYHDTH